MFLRLWTAALALACALSTGLAPSSQGPTVMIGKVVDARTGSGIPAAANDTLPVHGSGSQNIVIVMTDEPAATISGTVVDNRGRPRSMASVYVIPSDTALWTGFAFSRRASDASGIVDSRP